MKYFRLNKTSNLGFALIDVLIATLVLSVGVIAFVRLSNVSIMRSKEADYRAQASQSANTLVEFVRGNYMLASFINDTKNGVVKIASEAEIAGYDKQCADKDPVIPGTWCDVNNTKLYNDAYHELEKAFSENYQYAKGRAIMCFNGVDASGNKLSSSSNERPYNIRVTVIWKLATAGDAGPTFTGAEKSDCPGGYDLEIPNISDLNTVDRSKSDKGYFELYTRI